MYGKEKEISLSITIKYDYDSELEKIKELFNELINQKGTRQVEIVNKD